MLISPELVEQTRARYRERSAKRADTMEKLKVGTPLQADTPDRIERRVKRLAATEAARERPASSAVTALERIMGRNDLMSVNYLEIGLQAARCVGRIAIRTRTGRILGFGTGFTISPRLLLTNNHVLDSAETSASSRVEFNFQEDSAGNPLPPVVLNLDPGRFFLTNKGLDFTVVAVVDRAADGTELRDFCWLPLIGEQGKVLVGEYLNVIQHPNGEPKQLALRENRLIDLLPDFLHYETDTAPGSSGSPVFNDQWEVVGLHHSGVPKMDAQGRILTRDGTVWREEMGEHRIDWIANEGVRVSRIVQRICEARLSPEQERLRREMLEAQPALALQPVQEGGTRRNSEDVVGGTAAKAMLSDGVATWTLPLQVSVRIGLPASVAVAGPDEEPRGGDQLGGQDLSETGAVTPVTSRPETESPEVQAALQEAREARTRTYYDEEADHAARDAYYAGIDLHSDPEALFGALSTLLRATHTSPVTYKPMQHVYPWVDLHPDGRLRSVYSGKLFDAEELIREDAQIEAERARLRESFRSALAESSLDGTRLNETLDLLEAQFPFNCEHVVPQSWFAKREPMRGDLHHLFACEWGCNSFRGNIPYFDFADFEEAVRDECGKREEDRFEPANGKGAVARATLYFLLRYPGEINAVRKELLPERIEVLLEWHRQRPPSEYERHRNVAIFEKQDNRNPLIDFPDWARRIDFRLGLGD
jgi:endonuclease G